ncbi:hypothetical protein FPANT_12638 [Fusarium pseudoanthophilum]|uniref:Uncharacterized protein n=1 Tax=Fusarium pseudoanthophilum TaxID=48495 RepID=A0A8H5NNG9_9HYPO|nr:hypothetical protein FPANT_12638 [Fusarium pseudoanthophilum]
MARHHHLHEHHHDADQPDTPTMRGRPRHSDDDTPDIEDEPRTEETVVNVVDELPRSGLVIFDDCVSLIRVDNLSERARNRWREEEQQHQEQPQETQPQSQIPPSIYDGSAPILSSPRLTQISRACIIASHGFYVVNCDTSGPQVNICWRVPGPRNIWLARLAASPDGSDTDPTPRSRPSPLSSLFLLLSISSYHNTCIRILNVNISDPNSMPYRRTTSRAECRRRKALRRAQGNEQRNIAVSGPVKVENGASTLSEVPIQNISAQNASRAPRVDAPPRGEATRHDNAQRDTSQNETNEGSIPRQRPLLAAFGLLRILPAVEIHTNKSLLIKNPRPDGPPTDICARIPGSENSWAARVSCYDSLHDLRDWILRNLGEEHPEIWMYVSTTPHGGFVDFYGTWNFPLVKPLSIVVISNPGHPLLGGQENSEP